MDNISFWQKSAALFGWLGIIFPLVAAIIAGFGYYANNKVSEIEKLDANARILEAKAQSDMAVENASNADVKAAEANEKAKLHELKIQESEKIQQQLQIEAANAKAKQAQAEIELEKLRITLNDVREDQLHRSLTDDQKIKLTTSLSKLLPDNIQKILDISYPANDPEANAFGKELSNIFTNAGWRLNEGGTIARMLDKYGPGISLRIPIDSQRGCYVGATLVVDTFKAAGFLLRTETIPVVNENYVIELRVGSKLKKIK